ncbi:MAG: 3-deoxy-7-phosphoheptulonate synthase [Pseudomonadota bacterium]
MLTPAALKQHLPVSATSRVFVDDARSVIGRIIDGADPRLLVIVGPCSIHDVHAAHEYAGHLKRLQETVAPTLYLVMRTYFEKPRTTVGWRGLLDDPRLSGQGDLEHGLTTARELLRTIVATGLPCATESLDPMLVPYLDDLVAWTAIGARTAESQIHRAMASQLPMPVGIKNGTDGRVVTAVDGVETAASAQRYLGLDDSGSLRLHESTGNPHAHVVLRGGQSGSNFDAESVANCAAALKARSLQSGVIVDCSHANSNKQHERQLIALDAVAAQLRHGQSPVRGVMLESNLFEGNQKVNGGLAPLRYGVSITDACLGWEQTESALRRLHQQLSANGLASGGGAAEPDSAAA